MTLIISANQVQQMADAQPGQPMVQPCVRSATWIEFCLTDTEGNPIPGEPYKVRLPDQSLQSGRLNSEGIVRFDGIVPGQAMISFPNMDAKEWWPL